MIKNVLDISKFGRDTIWLLFGQGVAMGSGLFLNLFIGFKYGTASLGVFNQSLAYYLIFSTLFALGLNNTIVKKVSAKNKTISEENKVFTSSLMITLIVSFTFSGCLLACLLFFPTIVSSPGLAMTLPSMIFALPLFGLNKNFSAYYNANRKQRNVAFQRIYRWGGISILFFLGGGSDFSFLELMHSFLLVEGSLVFINVVICFNSLDFSFKVDQLRESIIFGMGSYVSEITSTFNSSIDIIIVAYFLSEQDAGQYSFIAFFVRTLYVFPGILMQNVTPIISYHWAKNEINKLNGKLNKVRKVNLMALSFQFLVLLIVYRFVILGDENNFESNYSAFLIAMVGTFLFAQISWGGSILIMTDKLNANFQRTLIVLLVNAVVCTSFTYSFGFMGSVSAISINAILSFLLLKSFVYRKTGVRLI